MRPRGRPPDSRARILAAAAAEFAARGFDGASVDRIARAARLNKAMIYYHFKNKAALHGEIVRGLMEAVLARARAIAASAASPREQITAFVHAIVEEAESRPHFPPMWLREIAEGGRHLDRATFNLVRQVPEALNAIIERGCATGEFRRVHPLLLHFSIIGPLVLYFASQPVRSRMATEGLSRLMVMPRDQFLAHVEHATLATLTPDPQVRGRRP
jgi:AcrR family transcriptional regulator